MHNYETKIFQTIPSLILRERGDPQLSRVPANSVGMHIPKLHGNYLTIRKSSYEWNYDVGIVPNDSESEIAQVWSKPHETHYPQLVTSKFVLTGKSATKATIPCAALVAVRPNPESENLQRPLRLRPACRLKGKADGRGVVKATPPWNWRATIFSVSIGMPPLRE